MATYDPLYLSGISRFNRGEYFECHEVWEDLWRATRGPSRLFYKGLIQAAVSLYHARRGNPHGAAKLFGRSCRALEGYRPCYLGLNVERLLAEVAVGLRCGEQRFPAGQSPGIRDSAPSAPGSARGFNSGPQIELSPPENGLPEGPTQPILEQRSSLCPKFPP